jgi:hypothetical protein
MSNSGFVGFLVWLIETQKMNEKDEWRVIWPNGANPWFFSHKEAYDFLSGFTGAEGNIYRAREFMVTPSPVVKQTRTFTYSRDGACA